MGTVGGQHLIVRDISGILLGIARDVQVSGRLVCSSYAGLRVLADVRLSDLQSSGAHPLSPCAPSCTVFDPAQQPEKAVENRVRMRRTPWDVQVDRHDGVGTAARLRVTD